MSRWRYLSLSEHPGFLHTMGFDAPALAGIAIRCLDLGSAIKARGRLLGSGAASTGSSGLVSSLAASAPSIAA